MQNSQESTWLKSLFNGVTGLHVFQPLTLFKKRLQHRYFPVEFTKFLRTPILNKICERLVLKPVLPPGLPFMITYSSGSNWYLCFSFYIIIRSFVCQSSFHYCWYCYNQKQLSGDVLPKRCYYKFRKIYKKTHVLEWSYRSAEFNFIKKEIPAQMFSCELWRIFS